ncbi:hypothetical protein HanXRQr2_Chr04g0153451 [Helianthus annuus]|uniref:Uncharacterized protein n=1 Tax=Helianthus annuus TaxID=4232 RepID=A0A9K3J6A2_HELAN|nr:hypothetical protein HanXRQr2_Chr04g0153451 [Helianthus annuus]KAJ0930302.1 hypothetical protein HanPSC8_Chr04g0147751 [Helianthus annuus]
MDGRGGIARYSGSNSSYGEITYGMSKVQRIMLKFRPIAPKPMAAGSGSSCSTVEHSDGSGGTPRRKRRYVRVNNNNNNKKNNNNTSPVSKKRKLSNNHNIVSSGGAHGGDTVVTLALMPETPDRKENSPATSTPSEKQEVLFSGTTINNKKPSQVLLSFNSMQSTHQSETKRIDNCDTYNTLSNNKFSRKFTLIRAEASWVSIRMLESKWVFHDW